MSNVIQFLESMGSNALMARMSAQEYQAAVQFLELNDEQSDVLLRRDGRGISDQLGRKEKLLCLIFSPSEEEQPDVPDQENETPAEESESE